MKKGYKLYFAYGMNTNSEQMRIRCPKARYIGNHELDGFEFKFRGVADIDKTPKSSVIGTLWAITKECEKSLDLLEGFPNFYKKGFFNYKGNTGMYYIMTKKNKTLLRNPSNHYLNCLENGYTEHDISTKQLEMALGEIPDYEEQYLQYIMDFDDDTFYYHNPRQKRPRRYKWVNGRVRTY